MNQPPVSVSASVRAWTLQLVLLVGIGLLLFAIGNTTLENLDRLGVQTGFEFLGKRAGFDINQALLDYSSDSPVYRAFLVALCNAVLLAVLSIALATAVGALVAAFRLSRDRFLNALGFGFIEVFRNIPALLQIFFWYYVVLRSLPPSGHSWRLGNSVVLNNRGLFLPGVDWDVGVAAWIVAAMLVAVPIVALATPLRASGARRSLALAWVLAALAWLAWVTEWRAPWQHAFGYASDLRISPELGALVLGLAIYNASSIAEVIRAGFQAVPGGQWEAARSLGLSRIQVVRLVVMPQALRVIIPPLTTCYLNIFKATSLGAAIGYPEIVSVLVGTTNNIVGRPVEIMFLTFAVYSLISLLGIGLMGWLNHRYARFAAA